MADLNANDLAGMVYRMLSIPVEDPKTIRGYETYRGFVIDYRPWGKWMEYVADLPNGLCRHNPDLEALKKSLDRRIAEVEALKAKNDEPLSLRLRVIDALVAQGIARPVAAERTNTPAKLDDQADALGML